MTELLALSFATSAVAFRTQRIVAGGSHHGVANVSCDNWKIPCALDEIDPELRSWS